MITDDPGSAKVISYDRPGTYTITVVECPCGGVVGECGCGEMVADWLRRFEQMSRPIVRRVIP